MADIKLKVTNRATGEVWLKTPDEIKVLKANKTLAPRFSFEKEVETAELAPKISKAKASDIPPPDTEPKS